ncbi:site-specific integrase [Planctobacterium marinum]|uniref:site-specific integrase n=1 Tax=Planctobacterium marinum TaxID=1631968 RepID=UPI001E454847|nr:site-specific integrase [Planctobacterium marinum]MCC2607714.1 site-specific integrase [Planctobacterium marinum]
MEQPSRLTTDNFVSLSFENGLFKNAYDPFVISKAGQELDLTEDKLRLLPEKLSINFLLVAHPLQEHFKAWFSASCKKYANYTLFRFLNLFAAIDIPANLNGPEEISEAIENYYKRFMQDDNKATEKSSLRGMYAWFVEEGFPYFDEDFYDFYLSTLKFGTDDGKGLDVLMELPDRGPLTFKEQNEFRDAMTNVDLQSLSTQELQGFFALKIGQLLGIRDVQVIGLQFSDLKKSESGAFSIDVKRAKQRGSNPRRTPKKTRPVTPVLIKLVDMLEKRYMAEAKTSFNKSWHVVCDFSKGRKSYPTGERTSYVTFKNRRILFEEYLNLGFKVTNRRLRKTFCTRLIANGTPLKVVAELMDHSDLQQLEVYYRHTHHIAQKLDKVLCEEAREIIDAFNGKVIKQGEESQAGQQIFAPVSDFQLTLIGSCGSGKPCSLNPPLACYGCKSLEAFEDADHKSVVDHMVNEIKRVFGEQHAIEILQHKNFLAAAQLVEKLEEGSL